MIKSEETATKSEETIAEWVRVWESSVRATHLFLSESEIDRIKGYVPQALRQVQHLIVAAEDGVPVAFAGVDGRKLEMLFVAAKSRGRGIGAKLLRYAIEKHAVSELVVNEQNPSAIGFYEHMGFAVRGRSDVDERGEPYPILYMKR